MECKELMKSDMPTVLPISKVIREGKDQKTVFVKHKEDIKPGQFYMLWIPGIDSKPYAVAYHNKNELGFTSITIGKFSNAFDKLQAGDKIGLFGPYGNSFSIKNNACVVAGGIGISSVSTLIDKLNNPIIIYGVRKKDYLIYLKRYNKKNIIITTDDGSHGRKCFTTDVLKELLENTKKSTKQISGELGNRRFPVSRKSFRFSRMPEIQRISEHNKKNKIKIVYTCGPEIMMKKVLDLCNKYNVECEASLERFMACGYGICGKCMINDKITCIDGPIFNSKQLSNMSEFGKFARLKSGKKVTLEQYHSTHT